MWISAALDVTASTDTLLPLSDGVGASVLPEQV